MTRKTAIILAVILLAVTFALLNRQESVDSEPNFKINDAPSSSPAVADVAVQQESQDTEVIEALSQPKILTDYESTTKHDAIEWAESIFLNHPDFVKYDRIRLVDIDWDALLMPIKESQQYLSAASGKNVTGNAAAEFTLRTFPDRSYRMMIEKVAVQNVNGKELIALSGSSYDTRGQQGSWNLAIDEPGREIGGNIDAPDGWTTFAIGPDRTFHVFRDISQERRQEQQKGKTY